MHVGRIKIVSGTTGNAISLNNGGEFTGKLSTTRTSFVSNEGVTKTYVDGAVSGVVIPNAGLYLNLDGSNSMTGTLTVNTQASVSNEVINKGQADAYITANVSNAVVTVNEVALATSITNNLSGMPGAVRTGNIIKKPTSTTPTGYLKCNGGVVSKSSYGGLYAAVGGQFNKVIPGSGKPWAFQFVNNATSPVTPFAWEQLSTFPIITRYHQFVVTKNRVYCVGTYGNTTQYTATINSDGTIGTWSTSGSLPSSSGTITSVIYIYSKVYLLCENLFVFVATVNSDGTLGSWTRYTNLPTPSNGINLRPSGIVITSTRIYIYSAYMNGAAETQMNDAYYALIDSNGNIGTWVGTATIPGTAFYPDIFYTNTVAYAYGVSYYSYGTTHLGYKAVINADGTLGTWTAVTDIPGNGINSFSAKFIVLKNKVFALCAVSYGNIWTATINSDDSLTTWVRNAENGITPFYAYGDKEFDYFITSSRIYWLGSQQVTGDKVYSALFTGGSNDYTETKYAIDTDNNFTLPNLTTQDATTTGMYSYIKT